VTDVVVHVEPLEQKKKDGLEVFLQIRLLFLISPHPAPSPLRGEGGGEGFYF